MGNKKHNVLEDKDVVVKKEAETSSRASVGLEKPKLYKVLLINDDYTPMDFVVEVLKQFFAMEEAKAISTMLEVHRKGKCVCGKYSRDIAETKVSQVSAYSKRFEYPLLCVVEQE